MKVVLDSNVVMAGFLWPGICTQFFDLANAGRIELFTSRDLIDEIREVLYHPEHAHHVARTGFTAEQLIDQYQRSPSPFPPANSRSKFIAMRTMMPCWLVRWPRKRT